MGQPSEPDYAPHAAFSKPSLGLISEFSLSQYYYYLRAAFSPAQPSETRIRLVCALIIIILSTSVITNISCSGSNAPPSMQDAQHITALIGQSVVFNCPVEFPDDQVIPYVMQWEKKVGDTNVEIPIFIWYESYPTHSGETYEGRVFRVSPDSPYGLASLNLTDIRESDQGWYECNVQFLNRPPAAAIEKNGTWFHLDVHAPPRFVVTPEEVIYVTLGDAIILNCQAEGTPHPEMIWYKNEKVIEPSNTMGIFNDGTELRISNIRREDIGDYTCLARNGEGRISHTARVAIAGGAIIVVPPTNQTKLEGERLEFTCGAKALPGNVTIHWTKDGVQLNDISGFEARVSYKRDGTLVISPVSSDDSGMYTCDVSNGIGEPQTASAYMNVEYPAKVTYTPTVQYLPFRMGGMIQCFVKANPPLQYVTWTKDKRLLEPYQSKDIVIMNNGSLFYTRVNQGHQGRYTCTPYNAQGTQGASGDMEVLVKKPPYFLVQPNNTYHRKVGESIEMPCDGQDGESTMKPSIEWRRRDGHPIKRDRVRIVEGNLTIDSLRRTDFGHYQCVLQNEVATIVADTQLVMEGTQPHAPYNVTVNVSETEVIIHWSPGYSGGPDYKQEYVLWYREAGIAEWTRINIDPPTATTYSLSGLKPSTNYEFQIVGKNALGDGMLSKIVVGRTLDPGTAQLQKPSIFQSPSTDDVLECSNIIFATDLTGSTIYPSFKRFRGPRPGAPKNVSVTEVDNGWVITWTAPEERADIVKYYTIMYRTDSQWKDLTKSSPIRATETKYFVKSMVGGRTYFFRIIAHGNHTYESSEEVKYSVPARVKQKAITAGVVGGILFFIVAIILSICAVKICNRRKRRKQEKAYNIVACRITDARNGGQIPPVRQIPLNKYKETSGCTDEIFNILVKCCLSYGAGRNECIVVTDSVDGNPLAGGDSVKRVRTISRAPDGRFILTTSSRCSSISSSIDDGGFLTHPAFRQMVSAAHNIPATVAAIVKNTHYNHPAATVAAPAATSDLSSMESHEFNNSHHRRSIRTPLQQLNNVPPVIYSNTPFLSSSPASSTLVQSPFLSPVYFSDLSSVQQASSVERTLRSVHAQYSQELPSLQAIHEQNERVLASYSPKSIAVPIAKHNSKLPPRNARYSHSAPELANILPPETSAAESHSSSSGVASKNTSSQQTGSSVMGDWRLPPYKAPPEPPVKPPYIRTWLDYTPSPTHSVLSSNKPVSVDDHYEFDPIFPSSPTPTELVLTPLPPARNRPPSRSRTTKQEYIEARVRAMKEEFFEYRRRQAQIRRIKELESVC